MSKFFDKLRGASHPGRATRTVQSAAAEEWLARISRTVRQEIEEGPSPAAPTASYDAGSSAALMSRRARIQPGQGGAERPAAAILSTSIRAGIRLSRDEELLRQAAMESYRLLRTRLQRRKAAENLRSILLTSAVQGEGKTLTAVNLGFCCAQLPKARVLLVDGDLRSHDLTDRFGLRSQPGLSDVLAGRATPDACVFATSTPGLFVLGAGAFGAPPSELFARPEWRQLMEWARAGFETVLVDAPPVMPLADCDMMATVCDGIVVVVRHRTTREDALRAALAQMDGRKLLGVVLNGADAASIPVRYADRSSEPEQPRETDEPAQAASIGAAATAGGALPGTFGQALARAGRRLRA